MSHFQVTCRPPLRLNGELIFMAMLLENSATQRKGNRIALIISLLVLTALFALLYFM